MDDVGTETYYHFTLYLTVEILKKKTNSAAVMTEAEHEQGAGSVPHLAL